jgi:site-specific recombinase XerD
MLFRRVSRLDKTWGAGITAKAVWHVVKVVAKRADMKNLSAHDLTSQLRSVLPSNGGKELEQILFLLGYASVPTPNVIPAARKNSVQR